MSEPGKPRTSGRGAVTNTVVCMRLAEMKKTRRDQDNSRVCSVCFTPVGIYPSGQAALEHDPTMAIVCNFCWLQGAPGLARPAPGALDEARESLDDPKPRQ
jgi:hypothetical protein